MLLCALFGGSASRLTEFQEHDQIVVFAGNVINPQNPLVRYDSTFFTFCGYPREFQLKTESSLLDKFFEDEQTDIGIHFRFLQLAQSTQVCTRGLSPGDYTNLKRAIESGFWLQFILDGLSAYGPIGSTNGDKLQYFSHWNLSVAHNGPYIIAFEVICSNPRELSPGVDAEFHYSLNWTQTRATSRSAATITTFGSFGAQFISLVRLVLSLLALVVVFTVLLGQRISRDIDGFESETEFDDFEAGGDHTWKSLHGDIFRAPKYVWLFAGVNGCAAHLALTVIAFVFVNMAFRLYSGVGLTPILVLLFVACSVVSGYVASSIMIEFDDSRHPEAVLSGAVGCTLPPLFMFLSTTFSGRSDVRLMWVVALIVADLLLVLPCALFGGVVGRQMPLYDENPCEVAAVPKRLPSRGIFARPVVICLIVGAGSATMFIQEAEVILTAMKRGMVSWLFVFLLLTVFAAILVAGSLAVATVYLLLVKEIHAWQWVSFLGPFSSAFFVFLYGVQYILTRTRLEMWNEKLIYVVYTLIVAALYGMMCGAAGFLSANGFVRLIFSNLKLA
jgi:transmembrane 9 superfamily protein 3